MWSRCEGRYFRFSCLKSCCHWMFYSNSVAGHILPSCKFIMGYDLPYFRGIAGDFPAATFFHEVQGSHLTGKESFRHSWHSFTEDVTQVELRMSDFRAVYKNHDAHAKIKCTWPGKWPLKLPLQSWSLLSPLIGLVYLDLRGTRSGPENFMFTIVILLNLRIPAMHEANTALLDILVYNSVIIPSLLIICLILKRWFTSWITGQNV